MLKEIARDHQEILDEPEPSVIFDEFGDSALEFELVFWAQSRSERGLRNIRSDLRYAIDEQFRAHSIVIAFPQRDVHLDGELTISRAKTT